MATGLSKENGNQTLKTDPVSHHVCVEDLVHIYMFIYIYIYIYIYI